MDIMDLDEEQKAEIKLIKDGLCITKVVATRGIKTKNGDFFVGMSAAWDTIQEDAGGMGADLIDAMGEGEMQIASVSGGLSTRRAKIAACILGMQVDLQATAHALGGGAITQDQFRVASNAIKRNYGKLLAEAVAGKNGSGNGNRADDE